MSAREELVSLLRTTMDDKDATKVANAYRAEVMRELIYKMRRQLAAGLKMPGYAQVIVLGGGLEPMGATHILDAWDPDRNGSMRPAGEALEELRGWDIP